MPRKSTQPATADTAYDGVPTVNVTVDAEPQTELATEVVVPLDVVDVPVEDEQPNSDED